MPPTPPTDELDHPRDAAHWFARMQSGEATEQDRQAFDAWRRAHPDNDRAYRNLQWLWEASLTVAHDRLRTLADVPPRSPPPSLARRRVGLGLLGAGSLAAVAGVVGTLGWLRTPEHTLTLMTRKGERRQSLLPDGSILDLNTDTLAVVRFYQDQRRLALQRGEIFLDVRRDLNRPFVVDAGVGQVTIGGTRLNVRRDDDQMQVSVESGSVTVQAGQGPQRRERQLSAGQQAVAHAGLDLGQVAVADVGTISAWQRGKVVFNGSPLVKVITEMNRYLETPVRLQADHLSEHRVYGVFSIDDPYAIIKALPAIVPVRLAHLSDGSTLVVARGAAVTK